MKNIAIIGSGISGLTAAYLLSKKHKVTVFEKNDRIGGHTATVDVELSGKTYAIDTGFIVFNNKTYPNYLALLDEIGVGKQEAEMSFSVHNCQSGLEYNGHNLRTLFAQKRNIFNPKFWLLIKEILRFNKLCKLSISHPIYDDAATLGDFLSSHKFSPYFSEHYILPMGAAIWSSSLEQMEGFQFKFFVQFFNNHGLLNISDRPQWYVIPDGSRSYLAPLCERFADDIRVNQDIQAITRRNGKVQLHFNGMTPEGEIEEFDEVVIACHSDQALSLLGDASESEEHILKAMPYSENSVVLHTDVNLLPKREAAWASWNYQLNSSPNSSSKSHNTASSSHDRLAQERRGKPASVTYNMNILQGIKSEHTFCVTLNQKDAISKEKILREFVYHHPVFSLDSICAQAKRHQICGKQNTHYAGAYWHNGFHEDGVRSAVEVAKRFDCFFDVDKSKHDDV